jgi:hypothetical protein
MHLESYTERLKLQERFIMSENVIEVLDDIGFEVDEKALLAELRVAEGSEDAGAVHDLVETVRPIANPKAVYKVSYVDGVDGDEVSIDGVVFTSRVLSANLSKVGRVFAYVGTCGREFDGVEIAADDLLKGYWLDTIKGMALHAVMEYLYSHIRSKFLLEKTAVQPVRGYGGAGRSYADGEYADDSQQEPVGDMLSIRDKLQELSGLPEEGLSRKEGRI